MRGTTRAGPAPVQLEHAKLLHDDEGAAQTAGQRTAKTPAAKTG